MSTISLTYTIPSSVTPANGKNTVITLGNLNGYATAQVRDKAYQLQPELYATLIQ
jgi:hypothetical protein